MSEERIAAIRARVEFLYHPTAGDDITFLLEQLETQAEVSGHLQDAALALQTMRDEARVEVERLTKQGRSNVKSARQGIRVAEAKWASTGKLLDAAKAERDAALAEVERLKERVERLETGLELIEASSGIGFDVAAVARAALAPRQPEGEKGA